MSCAAQGVTPRSWLHLLFPVDSLAVRRVRAVRILMVGWVVCLALVVGAGCSSSGHGTAARPAPTAVASASSVAEPTVTAQPTATAGLTGLISMNDSDAALVEPLLAIAAAELPGVDIEWSGPGIYWAYDAVCREGGFDLALHDGRVPEPDGLCGEGAYVEQRVGNGAVVFVVHAQNPTSCVTVDELAAVLGGEVDRWPDVGGRVGIGPVELHESNDGPPLWRSPSVHPVDGVDAVTHPDEGAVVEAVADDVAALGWVSYATAGDLDGRVVPLGIDDGWGCMWPVWEWVFAGDYPFTVPHSILWRASALEDPAVAALRDVVTARVEDLAVDAGLLSLSSNVPVPDLRPPTVSSPTVDPGDIFTFTYRQGSGVAYVLARADVDGVFQVGWYLTTDANPIPTPRDPTTERSMFIYPDLGVGAGRPQRFEVPADIEPGLWVLCPDNSDLACIVMGVGPDATRDLTRCEVCRTVGLGGAVEREDLVLEEQPPQ